MEFVHLSRHQRVPFGDLSGPEHAPRLWALLRNAFPHVLAVVLMPDHLHLFLLAPSALAAARRLDNLLRGFSCGIGRGLWLPAEEPEIVRGRLHVERMIRYIALNPCRDELVPDPLNWLYSTYRDWIGAVADPWVTRGDIAPVVRRRYRDPETFHRYVTSDPSVSVTGTPFPVPAPGTDLPKRSIQELQVASAVACRSHPDLTRHRGVVRNLFLALAADQGWDSRRTLAQVCGVTNRSARRPRRALQPTALPAARLCLGDARLSTPTPALASLPTPLQKRPDTGPSPRPVTAGLFDRPDFGRF